MWLAVSSLATAAFVFAGGDGEKTSSGAKVMTRAAEILDFDPAVLVSAMKQAKQEPQEERFDSRSPLLSGSEWVRGRTLPQSTGSSVLGANSSSTFGARSARPCSWRYCGNASSAGRFGPMP